MAATVLGAAACGGTSEPEEPGFTIAAFSVDGSPLPADLVNWPDFHLELLADTIRILPGKRWDRVRVERFTGFVGVPEIRRYERSGHVGLVWDATVLIPDCPPDADCPPGEVLLRDGDEFWIEERVSPEEWVEVRFRIVPDA